MSKMKMNLTMKKITKFSDLLKDRCFEVFIEYLEKEYTN